tara:strand:- start:1 stop:555 length:555 start_codon:yes stop_codon:yes gene_type:complete
MLVLGLLVSFVQAQQPPRDIDKDAHKANKDVKSEAKHQNKAQDKDNKAAGDHDMEALQGARLQDIEGDAQSSVTQGSAKKGAKGVTKGSPNMAPSARVSGDRQLAGTQNTSASPSGKKARKGALGRVFSRIFGGGGEKVDGSEGKTGAQRASDGQDQPSGGQGQQPKGNKGAPGPKSQDDGGGR